MGRSVASWRAHVRLVLAIPALLCARGLLAQSTTPGQPTDQQNKQIEASRKAADERTHPVVDEVKYIGATKKAIDVADMKGGQATKASACRSMLLKPFCL